MAERDYRRLTRSRRRRGGFYKIFGSRSSLWLGKDHLLSVDVSGFSETYKRFYFRDIQKITIRTTWRRTIWNVAGGVLFLIFLAEVLIDRPTGVPSIIVTVILGVLLLLNNILGTACRVYLQTAVQVEELPSLSRVRRTRRVWGRIRPRIAESQGLLTPEEASSRLRETIQSSTAAADTPGIFAKGSS